MIRLFVALELPSEIRDRLAMLSTGIDGARFVASENLHITLRFIGDVEEPVIDDIVAPLARIRAEPFPVTLTGAGHFESGRRVRAVWIGVEKSRPLMELQERIEAAVARAGLPPEGRRFVPHITMARLRNVAPGAIRGWLSNSTLFRAVPFQANRFVLFSSHLGREGSHYRIEEAFPLGENGHLQFEHEDWADWEE